ncbi:MAG: S-layer homology domain-containing protein [Selenomonadaceae bacterium]|nr:S-layer homology domain-containing protein [Selenomonadaceae bacterium]
MKKTVAAALTAAFVAGMTSSALAASNPFSDVPAGHWAYQSVAKLAAEGVIEGYGDGTYRGDRNITRYEMAQMIAKAMAKNPTGASKADLDRLAAEFRDELDALGVRVAELEKYADKVVWTGELRYRYWNDRETLPYTSRKLKRTNNQLQLRLFPTATVNDHWKIKARMTASSNMKEDTTSNFKLTYAYAEGKYFDDKLTLNVGRMPLYTNVDDGLVFDDFFSGFQAIYGDKFKVALMAGRWNLDNAILNVPNELVFDDSTASYQGAEISYDNDKLFVGVGYHHFRSDDFEYLPGYKKDNKKAKNANVWAVGARYNFDNGFKIRGAYASNTKADEYKRSWTAGIGYKGADRKVAGSWGIGVDYRYVGQNTSMAPTFDTFSLRTNKKGVDISVDWAPLQNTYVKIGYFTGKTLDTKKKDRTFFGRASWFF